MRRFALPAALAFAAAGWLAVASQKAAAIPPPAKPAVAVVSLDEIYNKWSEVKEFADKLADEKREQEADLKKMQDRVKEKQAAAEELDKGSKERQKLEEEISALQAKAAKKLENWNAGVKTQLDEGILKFYGRIEAAISEYAKEQGITLVLTRKTEKLAAADVEKGLAERVAIYADSSIDITADVLKALEDGGK